MKKMVIFILLRTTAAKCYSLSNRERKKEDCELYPQVFEVFLSCVNYKSENEFFLHLSVFCHDCYNSSQ